MTATGNFPRLAEPSKQGRLKRFEILIPMTLALLVVASSAAGAAPWHAKAKSEGTPKGFETATLLEAAETMPCGGACGVLVQPSTAFCFQLGDQVMVGEGRGFLHEDKKFSGAEDLAGKQVLLRSSKRSLWVRSADLPELKLARGSRFEQFKGAGCIREVRRAIVALADKSRRPSRVPGSAMAIVGPDKGDSPQLFLWFDCNMETGNTTIGCRRWYRNGDVDGKDWYCAQTIAGAAVGPDFSIDPLLSQAGRLVLTSGAVLKHDGRIRINDMLQRPGDACF